MNVPPMTLAFAAALIPVIAAKQKEGGNCTHDSDGSGTDTAPELLAIGNEANDETIASVPNGGDAMKMWLTRIVHLIALGLMLKFVACIDDAGNFTGF
ncbi:hypothetical protein AX14_007210 [Amanita brunnescens Koide BX004]|nr:hypothetical protein AX14_007210 [Amanita brunnescens Koide BX004]